MFQIFAYVHLDCRIRLAFIHRLGASQEPPHNVFMGIVLCISVESLVVFAWREDTAQTYAENCGVWPMEGSVKREKADGRVPALDGAPQIFTVLAEVVISRISLSPSSGSTRASLTYQQ